MRFQLTHPAKVFKLLSRRFHVADIHAKCPGDPRGLARPPGYALPRAIINAPKKMTEQCGDDLFLFSSDYPHPEGTKNPIERFESMMDGMTVEQRDGFYHGNYEAMMRS